MLNNSDKINFESNKTSHMITIRFFSNRSNMFFERRIVVNKYESIKDSLQYFIKSIGEVDIQHYSITL